MKVRDGDMARINKRGQEILAMRTGLTLSSDVGKAMHYRADTDTWTVFGIYDELTNEDKGIKSEWLEKVGHWVPGTLVETRQDDIHISGFEWPIALGEEGMVVRWTGLGDYAVEFGQGVAYLSEYQLRAVDVDYETRVIEPQLSVLGMDIRLGDVLRSVEGDEFEVDLIDASLWRKQGVRAHGLMDDGYTRTGLIVRPMDLVSGYRVDVWWRKDR